MNDASKLEQYFLSVLPASDIGEPDHEKYRVDISVPDGWEVASIDEHRLLLLMADLADPSIDGFAPNVIVELTSKGTELSSAPGSPPEVLSSRTPRNGESTVSTRAIALNETASGETLFQLLASDVHGSVSSVVTCSALDRQWSKMAAPFDEVIESLKVGMSNGGDRNEV